MFCSHSEEIFKPFRDLFWDCYGGLIHSPNARHQLHSDRWYIYNHVLLHYICLCIYIFGIYVYIHKYTCYGFIYMCSYLSIYAVFFSVCMCLWMCEYVLCYVWMILWSESANFKIRTLKLNYENALLYSLRPFNSINHYFNTESFH